MESTRRQFIHKATLAAVCTQLSLPGIAQVRASGGKREPESDAADPLAGVTAETFEAWIGSTFRGTLNRQSVGQLTLVSVKALDPPPSAFSTGSVVAKPSISSFALKFSKAGAPLVQGTYSLDHDWLGTFSLLLVPSGLRSNPATCTAVFNLLKQ